MSYDKEPATFHSMRPNWDKPCWSVGALLEALPGSFSLFNDETYWGCEWSGTDSDFVDFTTCECNTAIEALCKTVVWILENC